MHPLMRPMIIPLKMQKDSQGLRVFKLWRFGAPVFGIYFGVFGRRAGALVAFLVNALINRAVRTVRLSPRGLFSAFIAIKAAFLKSKQSKITGSTR